MQQISDDTVENKNTGEQGSAPCGAPSSSAAGDAPPSSAGSRTGVAARQFMHAASADLAEMTAGLRRALAELSSRVSQHVSELSLRARQSARDLAESSARILRSGSQLRF